MSVTYTDQPHAETTENFVPRYAQAGRSRAGRGKVRTWMILAPIGAVVIGGIAAAMIMNTDGQPAAAPLAEPALTAPVAAPVDPALTTSGLEASTVMAEPAAAMPPVAAPAPTPAPVAAAPVRHEAPAARRAAPPAPVVEATPVEPTGPRPYTSEAGPTPSLNINPSVDPVPATPVSPPAAAPALTSAPSIPTQPLN